MGRALSGLLVLLVLAGCGGGSSSPNKGAAAGGAGTYLLSGRAQKGPFSIGSQISVAELNAGLAPTGNAYNVQTSDALGSFSVLSRISTPLVEIVAQGFYIDELSGQLSGTQIQLRAIVDLSAIPSPTVNILTTLQAPRLRALVSQGISYSAAYAQSQSEVLALFGIDSTKVASPSSLASMRIDGTADPDSVLLAASVIVAQMAKDAATANGTIPAAELSNLINTAAAQLAGGNAASPAFLLARNHAQSEINIGQVSSNLQAYYATHGVTITPTKFAEWLDRSGSGLLPQRLISVAGLSFTSVSGVTPGQLIDSNPVTIGGLGAGVVVPLSVIAGTTILKNNVAVAGIESTVHDGDVIGMRAPAPGYGISSTLTITAGTSVTQWTISSKLLGGSITGLTGSGLVLSNNGVGDLAVPAGSTSFTFPGTWATGSSLDIRVRAQPNVPFRICSVTNGTGTVGTLTGGISIACGAISDLALVANAGSNDVSVFAIDPASGRLFPVPGSPFSAGAFPSSIAVSHNRKFAYVVNAGSTNVSAYSINPTTGALVPLAGSPFAIAGYSAHSISIDPSGRFAYVSYGLQSPTQPPSGILGYEIDATSGALTPLAGNPFPTLARPISLVFNPVAPYVYSTSTNGIRGHAIDSATGALTQIVGGSYGGDVAQVAMAIDPTGRFAYVARQANDRLTSYAIDPATGSFTPIVGSSVIAGNSIAIEPAGRFAYVSSSTGSNSSYRIDSSTGTLAMLGGDAIFGQSIAFAANGKYVYATNGGQAGVSVYALSADTGAASAIDGNPVASGSTAIAIAATPVP